MIIPRDVTTDELAIIAFATAHMYALLDDPIDKFIMAMVYELGYSKYQASIALGISPPAVTMRDKKIRRIIEEYAKDARLIYEDEVL